MKRRECRPWGNCYMKRRMQTGGNCWMASVLPGSTDLSGSGKHCSLQAGLLPGSGLQGLLQATLPSGGGL
ncbi:hypothetical protein MRB53_016288 [Persea americana]|uniref:Uncharacterized protein n=1 Tax=Persea americana TaxID=3435 RepID=A0ACC2M1L7_PERAE|nr:hypothetical protein MRB53_016288 [Persea americana]